MSDNFDSDALLRLLGDRPMHLIELCDRLGVARREKATVERALDALRERGRVKEMPGQRYRIVRESPKSSAAPATAKGARGRGGGGGGADDRRDSRTPRGSGGRGRGTSGDEVVGRLAMHPRGFGFVAAEDGTGDVFIPGEGRGGAVHGDRVRVRTAKSRQGREGTIVEVLRRGASRLTGSVDGRGRERWFVPDDPRYGAMARIAERGGRGGGHDAGASRQGPDADTTFIAEIVHYPEHPHDALEVRITEALGKAGLATVEVEKLKIRDGVVEPFAENVLREAEAVRPHLSREDLEGREDLRGVDLVTIDPPDARDHDDAIWAERKPEGGYRVIVAIADVSHYVRPGTAIDDEAFARGCTIYLPDRAIPMLPKQISSGMASLVPNEDRLFLGVDVDLATDGAVRGFRYIEGVMRSGARLTYGGLAHAMGWVTDVPAEAEAERRRPLLATLSEVSALLRARRRRRGSLEFDLPEARVKVDEETGEPLDVYRARENPGMKRAYGVIEDFMLLANEVVAEDLTQRQVPAIYRVHGRPDPKKLSLFVELAQSLGHNLDEEAVLDPKVLAAFLAEVEGSPHAPALNKLLLRSMQQAIYDVANVGHFALAAKDYVHFTSPIRRYPDLTVHRTVRSVLRGTFRAAQAEEIKRELKTAALESSRLERRAMILDRDVVDLYRALLLTDRVGEDFHGTVSGVAEHGIYVALDAPYAEVLVPFERLPGAFEAHPLLTEASDRFTGFVYKLGDRVELRLESVSLGRRELRGVFAEFADDEVPASSGGRGRGATGARPGAGRRQADFVRPRGRGDGRQERGRAGPSQGAQRSEGRRAKGQRSEEKASGGSTRGAPAGRPSAGRKASPGARPEDASDRGGQKRRKGRKQGKKRRR